MAQKFGKIQKDLRPLIRQLSSSAAQRAGWTLAPNSKGHVIVLHHGQAVTVIKAASEDPRTIRNVVARLHRLGAPISR